MRLAQYRTRDPWSAAPRAVPRASPRPSATVPRRLGVASGLPAVVVNAKAAAAIGSLAVPSGSATIRATGCAGLASGRPDREQRPCGAPHRRFRRVAGDRQTSRSRAGQVTDRRRALWIGCRMSNRPAVTPAMRLHCSASQAEPNADFVSRVPQSMPVRRRGVSAGTIRNCGAGSAVCRSAPVRLRHVLPTNRRTDDFRGYCHSRFANHERLAADTLLSPKQQYKYGALDYRRHKYLLS